MISCVSRGHLNGLEEVLLALREHLSLAEGAGVVVMEGGVPGVKGQRLFHHQMQFVQSVWWTKQELSAITICYSGTNNMIGLINKFMVNSQIVFTTLKVQKLTLFFGKTMLL